MFEQKKNHFEIVKTSCENITNLNKTDSINSIKKVLEIMNKSSFELKEKKNSMQKSLTQKLNIAGKDWINSKYKKIISYLTALIRKSNEALEKSLNVRDSLSSLLCTLQNSSEFWTDMPFVPLHSMKNCWFLDENYYEPLKYDKYKHIPVKQRTDE